MAKSPKQAAPAAVELRLDLLLKRAEAPIAYAGDVELEGDAHPIAVTVVEDAKAADGLGATAEAASLPDGLRVRVERLAASMARKAVRGARKDDMGPPRRIRRWRSVVAGR